MTEFELRQQIQNIDAWNWKMCDNSDNEANYLMLVKNVLQNGEVRKDRTGVGTISLFGVSTTYNNVQNEFPLLTTKKTHFPSIVHELLWFLKGHQHIQYLKDNKVTIWDEWAKGGSVGELYGHQWRNWNGEIDQIKNLIEGIRKDPYSRRHVVSTWNPSSSERQVLAPCHVLFQLYVRENGAMDMQLYQRSCDLFLGCPFNIASYSLLLTMICHITGYTVGNFTHVIGDAHVYSNHFEQVLTQMKRVPYDSPSIYIDKKTDNIDDITFDDIKLINYNCHSRISAPVAV